MIHINNNTCILYIEYLYFFNQTWVAVTDVMKQIVDQNPDLVDENPDLAITPDYDRVLIISLGTGSAPIEHQYDAESAAKWGVLEWLLHQGSNPLVNIFTQASADMVDYHLSAVSRGFNGQGNYLRIQVLY